MAEATGPMTRAVVPEADLLIGTKVPVLTHGFVSLVDYMGNDAAIVQAARVSYGKGTRSIRDDRGLIRYLMRHRHTTPFEMVEYKFLVRLPIFVARQWIRHRTACLAEGTRVYFDLPSGIERQGNPLYPLTVEEIWAGFQPTRNRRARRQRDPFSRKERVQRMRLRQLDEARWRFGHTRVVGISKNGPKPVFRMRLADGKFIDCTADHRFLFAEGWATLAERTGLHEEHGRAVWSSGEYDVNVNGTEVPRPALYRDEDWFDESSVGRREGPSTAFPLSQRPRPPVRRLVQPKLVRVGGFEFLGERMTYDLEVAGPFHNFVANGIVTHNSVNEYSARYSVVPDEYEVPPVEEIRYQSQRNRQGSSEPVPSEVAEAFRTDIDRVAKDAYEAYSRALNAGIARETARLVLPVAYYTQWYWKINLWNLLHFLSLRLDLHAQEEIRLYAAEIAKIARVVCPIAFEAFEDFELQGLGLGRREQVAVRALLEGKSPEAACEIAGLPLQREDGRPMTSGEGVEFLGKLERLRRAE